MQLKQTLSLALASTVTAQGAPDLLTALASQNSSLSTLNGLLASSGIGQALSTATNVTILAPNNDALNALLKNTGAAATLADPGAVAALLSYHVLNGTIFGSAFTNTSTFAATHLTNSSYANVTGGQRVEARVVDGKVTLFSAFKQNATVVTANVNFTGGTIHIINNVLSLPTNVSNTLVNANATAAAGAIRNANLESALGSAKDLTIFAPSNEAFNAIGSIASGLSQADLAATLGYHVFNGTVAYSSTLGNTTVKSLSGQDLKISVINGSVFVNAARVIIPDLLTSNGVVHVINQVLNPANSTVSPDPSAATPAPAFSGASTASGGLPFTSGIATPSTTFPAATATATARPSSTSNPAMPMKTGAVGAAALFGGAAMLVVNM